jgi:chorismate mutase
MQTITLNKRINGKSNLQSTRPLIISGPCSAETEKQVLDTAHQLKRIGITIFRAGIWKPRTRPNSFEGVGTEGLQWLTRIKQETGMKTATEVANVKHVYAALRAGIDILWIGARSTANPFAMQEIAEAIKGVDIQVLVKNPVNPEIDLWIGAIERLIKAGISDLGAIHRGFSSYEKSIYRNLPHWQIPIELKRHMPEIPLLCDPSHIAGKRNLILEISQKAMDLNYDGLMIESHINPDAAWSDSQQQLKPEELRSLMDKLVIREVKPEGLSLQSLEELRCEIDKYDDELLNLIKKRMEVVNKIGIYKKQNNITILQPNRWDEILRKSKLKARDGGLSLNFITKIYKAIHQEAINKQTAIMNK